MRTQRVQICKWFAAWGLAVMWARRRGFVIEPAGVVQGPRRRPLGHAMWSKQRGGSAHGRSRRVPRPG